MHLTINILSLMQLVLQLHFLHLFIYIAISVCLAPSKLLFYICLLLKVAVSKALLLCKFTINN